MPASEQALKKGTVRRSAPSETSRRRSCGVAGSLRSRRGREARPSGTRDSDADSYSARPERYDRRSCSRSSR